MEEEGTLLFLKQTKSKELTLQEKTNKHKQNPRNIRTDKQPGRNGKQAKLR